jgi:carbonic anhydrase
VKKILVAVVTVTAIGCASNQAERKTNSAPESSAERRSDRDASPVERIRGAKKSESTPPDWGYSGEIGPSEWGGLGPEFAMCALGKNQSPVDLAGALEVDEPPEPSLDYAQTPSEFVHKGQAIQVNYSSGNTMSVEGRDFQLLQMHFHTPSEHTVDGETFPLEAHFVHADEDGNLAVLGLFVEEGEPSDQIEALLQEVPTQKGQTVSIDDTDFDASEMLPDSRENYRYNGSLTTPPCSEGVRFYILTETVTASPGQIRSIHDAVGYDNARPVQPLDSRIIVR